VDHLLLWVEGGWMRFGRCATVSRRSERICLNFLRQLAKLDNMMRTSAKGYSLHPLYSQVPDILRGYVELVYDLNHQPSFRMIEPLLYKSRYYDQSMQSLMLSAIRSDDRAIFAEHTAPGGRCQSAFANPICQPGHRRTLPAQVRRQGAEKRSRRCSV